MTKDQKRILDLLIMIQKNSKVMNNYRKGLYVLNKELKELTNKEAAKRCSK